MSNLKLANVIRSIVDKLDKQKLSGRQSEVGRINDIRARQATLPLPEIEVLKWMGRKKTY